MKRLLFVFCVLLGLFHGQAFSQNSTYTVTGTISDEVSKEKIGYTSVRILHPVDSTLIAGGSADDKGHFSLSVKGGDYVLKVSYMGYLDYDRTIKVNRNLNLGDIPLKENTILLKEAVVETNAIEMVVKGDTVEYNANAYRVQESSVVEDLLKKMPGVEIDDDGKITVHGKEVKKIMLEGKEFFSDDPKVASKNLPASMVDKLQVLDKKSDMSLMTGFDDGQEETVINLTVKPGMKEGAFGNFLAGYGSEDRYEANGMVNYLRNNTQLSALGGINNTNNAGMSDLGTAMFGSSGGGRGMRFGGRNGETKAITGGLNFATDYSDKFKWGGDVRYGNNDNVVSSYSRKEFTSAKNPGTEITDSWGNNKGYSFATNLRFEWAPDSLTKVIFNPRVEYNTNENIQNAKTITAYSDEAEQMIRERNNTSVQEYSSKGSGYKLNGNLDVSRKLNSRGRVLSLGVGGGYSKSERDGFDFNNIDYDDVNRADSIIDQRFFQDDKNYNWRAFASLVEPLGRNNFLELSYNVSRSNSETDKQSFTNSNLPNLDIEPNYNERDTANTRYVENDFINQNVSLKFRAQRQRENGHTYDFMFGIGLEPSTSKTTLLEPDNPTLFLPRKNYLNFAPGGQFNYRWDRRHNLRVDYSASTSEPSTLQLYDGVYSRNGLNTTSGNPHLKPSFQNRLNLRYQNFNIERESFMNAFVRLTHTSNAIVSTSVINKNGGRDASYVNVDGNMGGSLRFMFNMPLRNKKWSVNAGTGASYDINNTLIDNDKNKAKTLSLDENVGLRFRADIFDFSLRGNVRYSNIKNSVSTNNNRNTVNYGGSYDFNFYVPNPMQGMPFFEHLLSNLSVGSDINYSTNSGYADGFQEEVWMWNASISKQVFKDKSGTIRFKMYDILKERSSITRNYNATYVEDVITNTIPSYFMVNFVYRFQIFKGGAKMPTMEEGGRGGYRGGYGGGFGGGGRPRD